MTLAEYIHRLDLLTIIASALTIMAVTYYISVTKDLKQPDNVNKKSRNASKSNDTP